MVVSPSITFKTKTATAEAVCEHLKNCGQDFRSDLEKRVDLNAYSQKLVDRSITFEAWTAKSLIGLLAAYFNDPSSNQGFITNLSVSEKYTGMGIATHLMRLCLSYARENHFQELRLEVENENLPAIHLYQKFGFGEFENLGERVLMRRVL